ncbi:MAG: hypothetical protein RMI78_03085 [Nitrososphaerota archaeon]|nr:hypothetical protein [Nitrososphaerota archaeon]
MAPSRAKVADKFGREVLFSGVVGCGGLGSEMGDSLNLSKIMFPRPSIGIIRCRDDGGR